MENKKYFVFDGLVYGFKTTFANIRLMVFTYLITIASVVLAFLALGVVGVISLSPSAKIMELLKENFSSDMIPLLFRKYFIVSGGIGGLLGVAFIFLVASWVGAALIRISLDVNDTGKSSLKQFFSVFAFVPKMFFGMLIFFVMLLLGFLLFIIPGIILFLRFQYWGWFLIDENCGVIESFKKSWSLTRGHAWNLFGLYLVRPIELMVGFVVAGFFSFAFLLTLGRTYRILKNNKD